ncbi:hypothetical protein [Desulfosporosinus youngiae]|uniref:Uncharacterized protein n=1 Tax=Desulfosporosinus youngiae DSM 17734 TaxID=768710 RepID=H5Y291_9FIRM|nr:hypothetical protein [Desulfosporosinus youngiae]EHQ88439.1 hypothetical protein DesyoDRAFT_1271 [Desulfosporosinus youngiae DSM 17734]
MRKIFDTIKELFRNKIFVSATKVIVGFFLSSICTLLFYDQFMKPVNWLKAAVSQFEVNMPSGSEITWGDRIIINAKHPDDVEYVQYNWDQDISIKEYNHVVEVEFPEEIGEHVLNFHLVDKQGKHKSYNSVNYRFNEVLNAPRLILSQVKDQYYPFEVITLQAIDKDGVHHIGYAWDREETTPIYGELAHVQVPNFIGPHKLLYYAKDENSNSSKWKILKVNVIPLPSANE